MREIFEKIIKDSVESIADGFLNEITSHKKQRGATKVEEIHYNDGKDIQREEIDVQSERKSIQEHIDANKTAAENLRRKQYVKNYEPIFEHEHLNKIGIINAHSRNKRLNIMIICAAAGLVLCVLILTSYKGSLPGEVVGIISTVSGIFGACLKDAYSFEFGSSRGSKDKDDKISAAIMEKLRR